MFYTPWGSNAGELSCLLAFIDRYRTETAACPYVWTG